jgi:hypothetical protein
LLMLIASHRQQRSTLFMLASTSSLFT